MAVGQNVTDDESRAGIQRLMTVFRWPLPFFIVCLDGRITE